MPATPTEKETTTRHLDKGTLLGQFAPEALVVCPRCNGPALVTSQSKYTVPYDATHAKLVCLNCPFQFRGEETDWLGPGIGVAKERCPNCGFKWLEATVQR